MLESVEDHAHGAVAEPVDHDLPAAAIHHLHDALEILLRVVRLPARRGIVGVRRDHERRVGFDDAVHEHLDDAGLEARRLGMRAPGGVEAIRVLVGESRSDEQRVVHPRRQLARRVALRRSTSRSSGLPAASVTLVTPNVRARSSAAFSA